MSSSKRKNYLRLLSDKAFAILLATELISQQVLTDEFGH